MRCHNIGDVGVCALKLVQLLQLGKLEKGAVSTSSKYNSRNGRWFSQKSKKDCSIGEVESDEVLDKLYIQWDSLIHVNCKRGKSVSVEKYRVLAFFSKYYNKWFVTSEDKFIWANDPSTLKNTRVLARMVKKCGSSYQEVELEAGGDWGPKQIFCIKKFSDILKVENELIEM